MRDAKKRMTVEHITGPVPTADLPLAGWDLTEVEEAL
jgi:hypothetical protein